MILCGDRHAFIACIIMTPTTDDNKDRAHSQLKFMPFKRDNLFSRGTFFLCSSLEYITKDTKALHIQSVVSSFGRCENEVYRKSHE